MVWRRAWSFRALSGKHHPPSTSSVHQPGSSLNLILVELREALLHRHSWFNHWALATRLPDPVPPSSLPKVQEGGLKVPTLPSWGWYSSNQRPILRWSLKPSHWYKQKKNFLALSCFRRFQEFWSSVPGTGRKIKYVFLITNHMVHKTIWTLGVRKNFLFIAYLLWNLDVIYISGSLFSPGKKWGWSHSSCRMRKVI